MCSSASICQPADDHEEPKGVTEAEGEQELVADAGAGTAHGTAAKAHGMNLKLGWIMEDGEWLMIDGWLMDDEQYLAGNSAVQSSF